MGSRGKYQYLGMAIVLLHVVFEAEGLTMRSCLNARQSGKELAEMRDGTTLLQRLDQKLQDERRKIPEELITLNKKTLYPRIQRRILGPPDAGLENLDEFGNFADYPLRNIVGDAGGYADIGPLGRLQAMWSPGRYSMPGSISGVSGPSFEGGFGGWGRPGGNQGAVGVPGASGSSPGSGVHGSLGGIHEAIRPGGVAGTPNAGGNPGIIEHALASGYNGYGRFVNAGVYNGYGGFGSNYGKGKYTGASGNNPGSGAYESLDGMTYATRPGGVNVATNADRNPGLIGQVNTSEYNVYGRLPNADVYNGYGILANVYGREDVAGAIGNSPGSGAYVSFDKMNDATGRVGVHGTENAVMNPGLVRQVNTSGYNGYGMLRNAIGDNGQRILADITTT